MIRKSIYAFVLAALVSDAIPPLRSFAEGYAFSGLNINTLNVFWQSSVADPTNLSQGPLRDGTGSQVDLSDLDPNGGGGSGNNKRVDLESAHASGIFATCLGTCLKGTDDYTRPPSQPSDPLNSVQFARTNINGNAALFSVGHIKTTVHSNSYAELELNGTATGAPADASSSFQIFRLFSVKNADRMVFDFDADLFKRALRQPGLPLAYLDANSTFQIKLADNVGNTVLDFSPNGSGIGYLGATVIADPFNLNNHVMVQPPYLSSDLQFSSAGQFRVITPVLTPGVFYNLTITSGSAVSATNVPEPSIVALALIAMLSMICSRTAGFCWSRGAA